MASTPLTEAELSEVAHVLLAEAGVELSPGLRSTLRLSVERAAQALGVGVAALFARVRKQDRDATRTLVESCLVGETYFLRHPEQFTAVGAELAARFGGQGPLRAWSAGCSTGEEPYSLALCLREAGLQAAVLATDLSERALCHASEAVYGEWSLRGQGPALTDRLLARHGPGWKVRPELRKMVELRAHNLVREPAPGQDFHVVFCRNVLIYFPRETAARVLHTMFQALAPGGLLVLGAAELPLATLLAAEWVDARGVTLLARPRVQTEPPLPVAVSSPAGPGRPPAPASRPQAGRGSVRAVSCATGTQGPSRYERARRAARRGAVLEAEPLAAEAGQVDLVPEAFLLLASLREGRGDLAGAVAAARRALYLEPGLPMAHAILANLLARTGPAEEEARARDNALRLLEGVPEAEPLRGVEHITAGALRQALLARAEGP